MRRSKLEVFLDILCALVHRGRLRLTPLMFTASVNGTALMGYLRFLVGAGLVKREVNGFGRVFYVVTDEGRRLVKCFVEIRRALDADDEVCEERLVSYR